MTVVTTDNALLTLIADLYRQIVDLRAENTELRQIIAAQPADDHAR